MSQRPHDVLQQAAAELAVAWDLASSDRATILAVAAWAYEPLDLLTPATLAGIAGTSLDTMTSKLRRLERAGWVNYNRHGHAVTPGPRIQRRHEVAR